MNKHSQSDGGFLTDTVCCDWLTLTSFDQRNKRRWRMVMNSISNLKGDAQVVMGYVGGLYAHGFIGQREQEGQLHTMCRVSGSTANDAIGRLLKSCTGDYRATRIDIQLTIPLPPKHDSRRLTDYMRNNSRYKVKLIDGSGGMDTIYIGSRQSSHFWRIYVKESEDGRRWLRFEMEVKNGGTFMSDRLVKHIALHGSDAMVGYYFTRLKMLNLPAWYMSILSNYEIDGSQYASIPKSARNKDKTWRWMVNQVRPGIIKYALSAHGREHFVTLWLVDIIKEIDNATRDSVS